MKISFNGAGWHIVYYYVHTLGRKIMHHHFVFCFALFSCECKACLTEAFLTEVFMYIHHWAQGLKLSPTTPPQKNPGCQV